MLDIFHELVDFVLHHLNLPAHIEDDFDAREIHAKVSGKRQNRLELLQVLLGLRPDREKQILVTTAPELPSWARRLRLTGIRAFDRTWDVRLEEGTVGVEEIR